MPSALANETTVSYRPLSPSIGAEVLGLDMRAPFSDADAHSLREAFSRYGLLLLRGKKITAEQQTRFAELFGSVTIREKNVIPNKDPNVQHVSNTREDGILGTGELDFHMDQMFHEKPLFALILYGIEIPSEGGDTRFTNTTAAYEAMPEELKKRIEPLSCRHAYTFDGQLAKDWNISDAKTERLSAVHPLVWRDPDTGRPAIWINKLNTIEIVGLSKEDGAALMEEVRSYFYADERTYTHKWKVDDLLLWDNRVLQHARTPVDPTLPRTLRRTPILR